MNYTSSCHEKTDYFYTMWMNLMTLMVTSLCQKFQSHLITINLLGSS